MKLDRKTLNKIIKEELNSFLAEANGYDRSKIKYYSEEAKGLVYIRPKKDEEGKDIPPTDPIPSGYVRTAAKLGAGPRKPKRYQMNQVEILIEQPGFKAMEDVSIDEVYSVIGGDYLAMLGTDGPVKHFKVEKVIIIEWHN